MSKMTQPSGSVSTYTNIQSISRTLNISTSLVAYLSSDISINDYVAVYDQSSEMSWIVGSASGKPISWELTNNGMLNLVTSEGEFTLRTIVSSLQFIGKYEDSVLNITSLNDVIEYNGNRYYVNPTATVPFSTTGTDSTSWSIDKSNFYVIGDNILREDIINDFVILTWYGAVSGEEDSTSSFKSAYETGKAVYVPVGEYTTDILYPKQTFGPGNVYSNYTSDGLFNDPGQRVINPFNMYPQEQVVLYTSSRGNYERGAGTSIMFNMPDSRPQIMGINNDATLATYANGDAVAKYIGARGPINQQTLSNCTFTATTLTSTDLTADVASYIKVGMFCRDTTNNYRGRVVDIDVASQTITVNAWYKVGNTASGQIPTAGVSVLFNDVTKLWGQNTVIFIEKDKSKTTTATGYELGFQIDESASLTWGFDAVNYSASVQGTRVHLARGLWGTGYYAQGTVLNGFMHEFSTSNTNNIAFLAQNLTQSAFAGSILRYNTNYRVDTAKLIEIYSGGVSYWSISTKGTRSSMREAYNVYTNSTTLNTFSPTTIFWNGATSGTITVDSSSMPSNSVIELSNIGGSGVTIKTSTGNSSKSLAPGQSIKMLFDGNYLNILSFSEPRNLTLDTFITSISLVANSVKRHRFIGTADSIVSFDTSGMVEGQEFEIMNHSSSNKLTINANTSITLSSGGYAKFIYASSSIYRVN